MGPLGHGDADGGGGLHHVAAVEYVGPVLPRRDVHLGVHHVVEGPDRRGHVLLEVHALDGAAFFVGGEAVDVVQVVIMPRVVQVRHQDGALQRRHLSLRHEDRVLILHPVIRDAPFAQERQDVGRLRVAHLRDQHAVVLLVQRQHDGDGHDEDHQNSGDDDPNLFRDLLHALFHFLKEGAGLLLHILQPLSPPSLSRSPRRPVDMIRAAGSKGPGSTGGGPVCQIGHRFILVNSE